MPTFLPVHPPKNPDECPAWLYEALKRLNRQATVNTQGNNAISRGESPDGSGGPLVDTSKFLYKPGLAGGQTAYGDVNAGGTLVLSSTAAPTKGKIYLGASLDQVVIDEAQDLVGINKASPTATLHIVGSTTGSSGSIVPNSDINTNWVARGGGAWGGIGGTLASAMSADDGVTTMGTINTDSSGTNPQHCGLSGTISPGATYTVTFRISVLSVVPDACALGCTLVDSAGNGWPSTVGGADGSVTPVTEITSPSPAFFTVTRTVICSGTPAITGSTANSIRVWATCNIGVSALYFGVTLLSIAQAGSTLVEWDLSSGTASGLIDLMGHMGIGTGSASLTPMFTIIPDTVGTVGGLVKAMASQTANLWEFRNSANTLLSRFTSAGVLDGPITTVLTADFTDSTFLIRDDATPTKIAQFQCSGLSAGTRTFTFPDSSGTLLVNNFAATISALFTYTAGVRIDQAASAAIPAFRITTESAPAIGTYQFLITDNGGNPLCYYDSALGDVFAAPNIVATASFAVDNPVVGQSQILSAASGSVIITVPNVGCVDIVVTGGSQTINSKTFNTGNVLVASTASTGVSFADTTTSSKKLRMVLSGAVGNNNFVISSTAARTYTCRDLSGGVVLDSGSALTSGRVPFVTTGGALTDSSLFLFATGTGLTLSALNLITDTTTGMKIGTATTQKLSFWNATPIVQPTNAVAAATFVANTSGIVDDSATFDGYTLGQVVKALRNMGLLA